MRRNPLKLLACVGAIAIGATALSSHVFAEATTVTATLTTSSAITLTAGDAMDFGDWVITASTAGVSTLVLNPLSGAVADTAGTNALMIQYAASDSVGSITVNTPGAANIYIYGDVAGAGDFSDAALSLGTLTYSYDGGASTTLQTTKGAASAHAIAASTDTTVTFGGTITVAATTTPANTDHSATIDINVDY